MSPRNFHILDENETIIIGDYVFNFFYTPGHSEGSMCIGLNNALFTGDTLIQNQNTITYLPGGCKLVCEKSKRKFNDILIGYDIILQDTDLFI